MSEAFKWIGRFIAVFDAFKSLWETVQRADDNNVDAGTEQTAAALELARQIKRAQAKEELT